MKSFAFVFPGQGSQAVGMLDAWGDHPAVQQTLQETSEALGEDVARLIHEGPKEVLALTTNTQPVMLWLVWQPGACGVRLAVPSLQLWRVIHWVSIRHWWQRVC